MAQCKKKSFIIPGYQGIMDLDLTTIPVHLHRETIALHQKDIEEYKIEQAQRPKHLRYENVMPRVNHILENTRKMTERLSKNIKSI